LKQAQQAVSRGERQTAKIREEALKVLEGAPGVRVEYIEVVDPKSMQPIEWIQGSVRMAGAIWVGATRLIDNLLLGDESD
jgi:pantoate--beta-alanine ligase